MNASGLTPGAHTAHIHIGGCQSQGLVKYMFIDFTADSHGNIHSQTRVVTGVTSAMLHGGWYLNLHQGNSNDILSKGGQPTIFSGRCSAPTSDAHADADITNRGELHPETEPSVLGRPPA